jgi:actin related protein 2/3 complex subunit 3
VPGLHYRTTPQKICTEEEFSLCRTRGFEKLERMVYHSTIKVDAETTHACGCPLLPLRSHIKGPAPAAVPGSSDIIDEAINFFRANVLFRKFEVKGAADKLLIYLTLYINMALKRIEACKTEADGVKAIITLGLEKFPIPGEPGFPLGGLFTAAQSKDEGDLLRSYLKQVREETSGRLMEKVYRQNGTPNKWWLAFAKRKFMNIMMPL